MSDTNSNNDKFGDMFNKYKSLQGNVELNNEANERIKKHAINTLQKIKTERETQKKTGVLYDIKSFVVNLFKVKRRIRFGIAVSFATVMIIIISIYMYYPVPSEESASEYSKIETKPKIILTPPNDTIEVLKTPKPKTDKIISIESDLAGIFIEKDNNQGFGFSSTKLSDSSLVLNLINDFNNFLPKRINFIHINKTSLKSELFQLDKNDSIFDANIICKYKSDS